jgi:hypothetical protein
MTIRSNLADLGIFASAAGEINSGLKTGGGPRSRQTEATAASRLHIGAADYPANCRR